jgi:hypothetical protein
VKRAPTDSHDDKLCEDVRGEESVRRVKRKSVGCDGYAYSSFSMCQTNATEKRKKKLGGLACCSFLRGRSGPSHECTLVGGEVENRGLRSRRNALAYPGCMMAGVINLRHV